MSVISTSEITSLLTPVNAFLHCETPQSWIDEAQKEEVNNLIEKIEEDEDVQNVFHNAEL